LPKKTFECAEAVGATFITQAKDNQEGLRKQLEHGCRVQTSIGFHKDPVEKVHGRVEQRTYEVFKALPMLKLWQNDWPYIREVIRVTRYREELRKSKPTITVHYYVSNRELSTTQYAKYIREHWWIENKLHNVKDVAFQEDSQTKHVNPYIYSTCIDMALNIMRVNKIDNIKSSLYQNSLDFYQFYEKFKSWI
jgi:predicted transposase YbfD/YdcC